MMSYKKKEYEDGEEARARKDALDAMGAAPAYELGEAGTIAAEKLQEYLNRPAFSYDVNGDALYNQYADKYKTQGKLAMQDTMGQAAALTGGYGNSYAAMAGQQAYQGYMQELNDKIPELQQLAYSQYQDQGQELLNKYGLLSSEDEKQYQRFRDEYGDWLNERDYLTGRYDTERAWDFDRYQYDTSFDYGVHRDAVSDSQWQQTFNYGKERDAVSDSQWQQTFDYGKERDAVSDSQWQQEFDYGTKAGTSSGNGGISLSDALEIAEKTGDTSFLESLGVDTSGMEIEGILTEPEMQKASKNYKVFLFQNNLMSEYDFGRANGTATINDKSKRFDNYTEYVDAKLEEAFDNGELTENEIAYLKGYYGI